MKLYKVKTEYRLAKAKDVPSNWSPEYRNVVASNSEAALAAAIKQSRKEEVGLGLGVTIHRLAEINEIDHVDVVAK